VLCVLCVWCVVVRACACLRGGAHVFGSFQLKEAFYILQLCAGNTLRLSAG